MRVTLDRNELIHIQDGTGDTVGLRRLMEFHSNGAIKLCIPAIQASERQRDGTTLDSYSKFEAFLASLCLKGSEELMPMCYLDICYLDHCLLTDQTMEQLERQIHEVLFPNMEFDYRKYAVKRNLPAEPPFDRTWLRAKCDVQAMWSHMYHSADVFVTEDKNFRKATKKPRLLALGAGRICTPSECISVLHPLGVAP